MEDKENVRKMLVKCKNSNEKTIIKSGNAAKPM